MGIFDGVLLASDYDGTLRSSDRTVRSQDTQAIRRFQDEGGTFILATGRCYSTFFRQARLLPLRSPTLLSNGASFCRMETGETLFVHNLPSRCPSDVEELEARFPDLAFEVYFGEEIYCCRPNRFVRRHMELVGSTYTTREPADIPTPWLKVLLEAEHSALEQAQAFILERWSDWYECIFSNVNLLELTGKGVHKGSGVLEAAAMLGISREHVYCVGDNQNDLPMLRAAKLGFAPAGSVIAALNDPDIRITRDEDHGCVAHVIEILEELYRR